ncbi:SIR2 family protein [Clostridium sp. C105KSO13]|uniref:SIR2 family protein n=1 Tax=Clostridium sp. C105KSO13 TaxID=1776045 RepID=UPI0007406655|nr:SIR2 family protein [Clostridium sp. C105KSO13]CUX28450.1 NAD-dependent deacetylase [Clostridium sp. C105KSO13]
MNEMTRLAIRHINDAIKEDSLIVFVGAGVSANSGLPKWRELIDAFKDELKIDDKENDYLKIAQYYFDSVGQHKYFQKVMNVFQPHINSQPNEIHNQIFRIRPRHIITTNYDSLLEDKMNSSIDKYEVIIQDSDIPYSKSDHYLIKMHGDLAQKNIVLKEDDYLDYEDNFYMISTLIKSLIMNNTVLFVGYSLNDSTFNSTFRLIQKGFRGNARKAYFFTADYQNPATVEYYKNKGIQVIIGEKEKVNGNIGECTTEFLKQLKSESPAEPTTSEELWDNIRFLDQLYFVENRDVALFSNLNSKALLSPQTVYNWEKDESNLSLDVAKNELIVNFLDSKTLFNIFLDFKRNKEYNFMQNPVLLDGYKLYSEHKNEEAKLKFREIANAAFIRKDYWNYLVAEFNVNNMENFGSKIDLPVPSTGVNNLKKVIETLISNGDEQTKRICAYFRDEIQSFRFVYKKIFKMDDLLDKMRNERKNYKNGGFSFNDYLKFAQYEFHSLLIFVKVNCITVSHYKEFKTVVNRYFECLLIAFDNSNYYTNEDSAFEGTASIISELTLDDIQNIIPFLEKKNIPALLESYGLSKINVTDDCVKFLIDKIAILSGEPKSIYSYSGVEQYIGFLSFVKIKDINGIIPLLDNYPIVPINSVDIRKLLILLVNGRDSILEQNFGELVRIVNQHLSKIVTANIMDRYGGNFYLYSYLMEKVYEKHDEMKISIEVLEEKFSLINNKPDKLTDIIKYRDFIINFYDFLDDDLRCLINSILSKYEALDNSDINISFIERLALDGVYKFDSKRELILSSEIAKVNEKENSAVRSYPDPKKTTIADLYTFIQQGYFKLEEVKEKLDLDSIKGVFPEVDWTLFNDYSDNTILKLLHSRSFSDAREFFGKTDEEAKRFDEWLLEQALNDKIRFKNKNFK